MQALTNVTALDKILCENSTRSNLDSDGKVSFHLSLNSLEDSNTEIVIHENDLIKCSISSGLLKKCESEGVNEIEVANWIAQAAQTVTDQESARMQCTVHKIVEFLDSYLLPSATPLLLESPLFDQHVISINKVKKLDSGSFGNVFWVQEIGLGSHHHLPVDMVLKLPGSDKDAVREISSEINFLHELHKRLTPEERKKVSPNVHRVTYMGQNGYLMERFEGNLSQLLSRGNVTVDEKISFASQLVEQMAILSKYHAIYTDIKLDNVLTKYKRAVLSDFGNCHFIDLRKSIPNYGFTNTPALVRKADSDRLFTKWKGADDETLADYAEQHEARALGVLLCALFEGQTHVFSKHYYYKELEAYYKQQDPLKDLRGDHAPLCSIIEGMLGLGTRQLSPKEAWENWMAAERNKVHRSGRMRFQRKHSHTHGVNQADRLIHRTLYPKIGKRKPVQIQKAMLIKSVV